IRACWPRPPRSVPFSREGSEVRADKVLAEVLFWGLNGALYALPVVAIAWSLYRRKRRSEEMARMGRALHLSFTARVPRTDLLSFAELPYFGHTASVSGRFRNRLQGPFAGCPVILLEDRNYMQTVVVLPGGAVGLPHFRLSPLNSPWNRMY